jgi:DNA repair protein RecO (recombination protein O)
LDLGFRISDFGFISDLFRISRFGFRILDRVRALAKGGRRLKSSFESALDLLTVCSIVLLRKSSGGLDLLTEAQVVQRFGQLSRDLPALYAAYYIAELLADWTGEDDPHPVLFDEARATLECLGMPEVTTGPRLARFEWVLLHEFGYRPTPEACAVCAAPLGPPWFTFCAPVGGMVCAACQAGSASVSPCRPTADRRSWHWRTRTAGER